MSESGEGTPEDKRIKRLDETVVNRIAAGEIIQRPSNAIKEMLENSLDAKSTSIVITAKQGGMKLLQIQDNGTGIHKEDMGIVCERFTTSKLATFDDLNRIGTFGFRGEALASISHVAHVTIITRTASSQCAFKAKYSDGKLVPLQEGGSAEPKACAGNKGTQIIVEDLFYNSVTRRKALKNPNEEYAQIAEVVTSYAIHNSAVAFALRKQGETVADVRTPGNCSQLDNICALFGATLKNELLELSAEDDNLQLKIHGWVSNANYSVKKAQLLLFINNRLVKCSSVKKALDSIYANYLPKNSHYFAYISLQMAPENVDVNVHPTKKEVGFLHEDEIAEMLQKALQTLLLGSNASRTFYTQTLLPVTLSQADSSLPPKGKSRAFNDDDEVGEEGGDGGDGGSKGRSARAGAKDSTNNNNSSSATSLSKKRSDDNKPYEYNMVRTDSRSQTLDAFLMPGAARGSAAAAAASDVVVVGSKTAAGSTAGSTAAAAAGSSSAKRKGAEPEMEWDPIRQRMRPAKKAAEEAADEGDVDFSSSKRPATAATLPADSATTAAATATTTATATATASRASRCVVWPPSNISLTSVREARADILKAEHPGLKELFANHTFVGCINTKAALIQHNTKLYMVKTQLLSRELFRQLVFRGFSRFGTLELDPPAPIVDLVLIALDSPESGWMEEDGSKEDLAETVAQLLTEKAGMLKEYFAIDIDEHANLRTLPLLLDQYTPDLTRLPMFVLRMATEVDWSSERPCFEDIASKIGELYEAYQIGDEDHNMAAGNDGADGDAGTIIASPLASGDAAAANAASAADKEKEAGEKSKPWKWTAEHILFPAIKGMLSPPRRLAEDASMLQVADLHDLYKVFERC
eukprot:m.210080 g.210080  ORF g.210080 m.210080 type:complete len:866 (+) comp17815_c0_seq1:189-2786(+)